MVVQVAATRNHLFATVAILTFQISSFLIKMPFSLSSTTTLAGLSRPYLLATSIGIMIVELIFPLRNVCVTLFILVNLCLDLRDLGGYINTTRMSYLRQWKRMKP